MPGRKTTRKPAKKLAEKLAVVVSPEMPALVPQPNGGALLTGGVPGHVGAGGRPPNWLKDWCDELLADKETKKQVEEVLKDKNHAAHATMWKAVAERAHGKALQSVELKGAVEHRHHVITLPPLGERSES